MRNEQRILIMRDHRGILFAYGGKYAATTEPRIMPSIHRCTGIKTVREDLKKMTIVYDYFGSLYMNLTNKCPCRCEFCIRNQTDGLGTADSLFLDREPSVDEVMAELEKWELAKYSELVFCGYGEPTERLDDLLEIARRIKAKYGSYIRINTNGLSDLINNCETAPRLKGLIDGVSVSMNEADEEKYMALCHPRYGAGSYDAMIRFLTDVRGYVPDVACSVVGSWITETSIERCRQKAQQLGVTFKVR